MRTVCAMLNGMGGFVLFGVSDKGALTGQQASAKTLEEIALELKKLDPPAFPDIETIDLGNHRVILSLSVPGNKGLYTFDGRPYIKVGSTTSIMPKAEYEKRLVQHLHATRRRENEPAPSGISIADLYSPYFKLQKFCASSVGTFATYSIEKAHRRVDYASLFLIPCVAKSLNS